MAKTPTAPQNEQQLCGIIFVKGAAMMQMLYGV